MEDNQEVLLNETLDEPDSQVAVRRPSPPRQRGVFERTSHTAGRLRLALPFLAMFGAAGCAASLKQRSYAACWHIASIAKDRMRSEPPFTMLRTQPSDNKEACKKDQGLVELLVQEAAVCQEVWQVARAFHSLGTIAYGCGDIQRARGYYEKALSIINQNEIQDSMIGREVRRAIMLLDLKTNPACTTVLKSNLYSRRAGTTEDGVKIVEDNIEGCSDSYLKLQAYTKIGEWYKESDLDLAEKYYILALKTTEMIDPIFGPYIWEANDHYFQLQAKVDGRLYHDSIETAREGLKRIQEARSKNKEKLQHDALVNGPEVQELRRLLSEASKAEDRQEYEEANRLYFLSQNAGRKVRQAFEKAGVPIPRDIDRLGSQIVRGLRETEGRLGVKRQEVTWVGEKSSAETIEEGLKLMLEQIRAGIPVFVYILEKGAELDAKWRAELATKGFTANLTVKLAEERLLFDFPYENVEITVRKLDQPYAGTTKTKRTSKEGIIDNGGEIYLFLRPGRYEITSQIFRGKIEVTVHEGSNSVKIHPR